MFTLSNSHECLPSEKVKTMEKDNEIQSANEVKVLCHEAERL